MFEDAYYINLDRRPDRREEMETELLKLGISATRFPAIDMEYGPTGCILSHLAVIKDARDRGLKSVLIFEDDFTSTVSREVFDQTLERAKLHPCDVLMFAYNATIPESVNDVVIRLIDAQAPSAYIVYASIYDSLISCYEYHASLLESTRQHWIHMNDQCWKSLQQPYLFLGTHPKLGKQRAGFSDNTKSFCNYCV